MITLDKPQHLVKIERHETILILLGHAVMMEFDCANQFFLIHER